jgi:arabinofuranosyltransferase
VWRLRVLYACGLLLLCRHDLVTLCCMPALVVLAELFRTCGLRRTTLHTALALAPLALWSAFSLVYYGSVLPNTYYAKLHAGIAWWLLAQRGVLYMLASFRFDPMAAVVIGGGLCAALAADIRRTWPLVAGVACNLVYVVLVGGDFMAGRFLGYAYLWSAILLCLYGSAALARVSGAAGWARAHPRWIPAAAALCLVGYAAVSPHTPVNSPTTYSNTRIIGDVADERGFYFREASLWRFLQRPKGSLFPVSRMSESGQRLALSPRDYVPVLRIGAFGYWAGTAKTVLDPMALSDAFLARLPIPCDAPWRVGHYRRELPTGYLESVVRGVPLLVDPKLNELYGHVSVITRGTPVWSPSRLRTIFELDLGMLDHLVPRCRNSADRGLPQRSDRTADAPADEP